MVMDKSCLDRMPLISIVVPVFNVEAYVERCIKSLISQSYENVEIIMVDDGSTDKSGDICDKYKAKDFRIKVIHKSNKGLSDARNVGIGQARGKYISFVDSDDWVAKEYIAEMYKLIKKTNSDVVTCEIKQTSRMRKNKNFEVYKEHDREDSVKQLLYQRIPASANGKLYKIDLWDDVRFPIGKLYEDVETIYFIFNKCEKISNTNKIMYFYFFRNDSIVNQKFSIKKMDYVENCRCLLENVKLDYPQFEKAAISRLMWAEIHVLVHMDAPREYLDEYKMLMRDIKQYRGIVIKDRENKLKTRLVAGLSYFGYYTMKGVFQMMH